MPYSKPSQLPDKVRIHLPLHAQKTFMEAYNHAWKEYASPAKRTQGGSREEVCNRVAWSAVKKHYEKGQDGNWHRK